MNSHFCALFFCISLFLLSKNVVFSEKKRAVLTNWLQVYLGIPSANISLSAWEIKSAGLPLLSYWHWEALACSAVWHILAHLCLWSSHALWHKTLYSSSIAIFCFCIILPLHGFNYHQLAPAFYIARLYTMTTLIPMFTQIRSLWVPQSGAKERLTATMGNIVRRVDRKRT